MKDIIFNQSENRYEQTFENKKVFADVHEDNGVLKINYVEAHPALRGTGATGEFMTNLMEEVKAKNLKAKPICGYAASWLKRHDEYEDWVV